MNNLFTFRRDVPVPKRLRLEFRVYLHPDVIKGFEDLGCIHRFSCEEDSSLYGFDKESNCIRCDSKFHK
jgi:hypothetical protein